MIGFDMFPSYFGTTMALKPVWLRHIMELKTECVLHEVTLLLVKAVEDHGSRRDLDNTHIADAFREGNDIL
jgi:hypothetical protein